MADKHMKKVMMMMMIHMLMELVILEQAMDILMMKVFDIKKLILTILFIQNSNRF